MPDPLSTIAHQAHPLSGATWEIRSNFEQF